MKRAFFPVCITFFMLLLFPPYAFAHILKVDGKIGVTVHIDPDDQPVAGKESKIFVDIQDQSGRFNPSNPESCDCFITITSEGKKMASMSLVSGGTYAQLRYTFPKAGEYLLTIDGNPNGTGKVFQSFHTEFEYYAMGDTQNRTQSENPLRNYSPLVILIVGIGLVLLVFIPMNSPRTSTKVDKVRKRV